MGNIKKVVAQADIPDDNQFAKRLIVEWCENIHLHDGDVRLEFSESEFEQFAVVIFDAYLKYKTLKENTPELMDDEDKYHVLSLAEKMDERVDSDKFQIELQEEGHVHVHDRNLRKEMTQPRFVEIVTAYKDALASLEDGE